MLHMQDGNEPIDLWASSCVVDGNTAPTALNLWASPYVAVANITTAALTNISSLLACSSYVPIRMLNISGGRGCLCHGYPATCDMWQRAWEAKKRAK